MRHDRLLAAGGRHRSRRTVARPWRAAPRACDTAGRRRGAEQRHSKWPACGPRGGRAGCRRCPRRSKVLHVLRARTNSPEGDHLLAGARNRRRPRRRTRSGVHRADEGGSAAGSRSHVRSRAQARPRSACRSRRCPLRGCAFARAPRRGGQRDHHSSGSRSNPGAAGARRDPAFPRHVHIEKRMSIGSFRTVVSAAVALSAHDVLSPRRGGGRPFDWWRRRPRPGNIGGVPSRAFRGPVREHVHQDGPQARGAVGLHGDHREAAGRGPGGVAGRASTNFAVGRGARAR